MNLCRKSIVYSLILLLLSFNCFSQSPVVKIDFNQAGRSESETNEPGYTPWIVATANADAKTINGVTITLTKKGNNGSSLTTDWYKAGLQSPYYARLVNDGVTVKDGNAGGQIEIRLHGLPAGNHTLLTFHNTVQSPATNSFSPINISVDGAQAIDQLEPTNRVLSTNECKTAYISFTAQANTDVVILYSAITSGGENVKNVIINGLEINTGNLLQQSKVIFPKDRDEHVPVSNGGSLALAWGKGADALTHDIYFGTDSLAVANADHASATFKGNKALADSFYAVGNLYSRLNYYWRVDEVTNSATYKGNTWRFKKAQLAFPDAEGFGKYAIGGRGGKVVEVTNLNDAGPGSLREAVTNDIGPRVIVFNVSGIIKLQSRLVLNQPYVYVAGQTAPGKGICIRSAPFGITGNDAIVRFMRVRLGGGTTYDGMGLTGCNFSILDHASISWTIDEAFSSRGAKNITLQRSLISEALNVAGHQNYPAGTAHGYAATIGGDTGSFHHNLLAHCYGRNWSLGGGLDGNGYFTGVMDIVNNVVYNWGTRTTDGGAREVNFVNNYYKPGAGSTNFYALTMQHENVGMGTQKAYFNGNVMPGKFDESTQVKGRRATYSNGDTSTYQTFVNAPFFNSDISTQTAGDAYKRVLSDVGANIPVFDDHDIRMINETINGTYSVTGGVSGLKGFPDNEADAGGYENYPVENRPANWDSDHDGMPDWWEDIKGFNKLSPAGDFTESNADADMDGYTNLEDYLEWMATPHYFSSTGNIIIDLKLLARGYTANPVFVVGNAVNGSVSVNATGMAEFVPAANGLASFRFTVTDAQGSSMTRLVNLAIGVDPGALPVSLLKFDAVRINDAEVHVSWRTAQEINSDHFEIQRRMAGENNFKKTGATVPSKAVNGYSSLAIDYTFIDNNNSNGVTYYRLLQTDKDGKSVASAVRLVNGKGNSPVIKLWPTPSNGTCYVQTSKLGVSQAVLQVADASGKIIIRRTIANESVETIRIKSSGVYMLQVIAPGSNQVLYSSKLMVNK